MYSPSDRSHRPFWSALSLSVNRGPSSSSAQRSPPFLNSYLRGFGGVGSTRREPTASPVVAHKDVVALVVEGDDAPAAELRRVREEAGQHARHRVAQRGVEVVQHHFRQVVRRFTAFLQCTGHGTHSILLANGFQSTAYFDFLCELDTRQSKRCGRPFREMAQSQRTLTSYGNKMKT